MKKRTHKWMTVLAVGVMALCMGMGLANQTVYAAEAKGKITVSGNAQISVKPDIAYLTLGVSTDNADVKKAQEENNKQMVKVVDTMKALGIAEKDIQTSNYSIYPQRDYQTGGNRITGYTVSNSITVTIRDLSKAGEVLSEAVTAGANTGSGVQFSIQDSTQYYEQALALAIENAGSKAAAMAKALNKTVGLPIEITETGGNFVSVVKDSRVAAEYAGGVPIESGELTVSASIQAVYEY